MTIGKSSLYLIDWETCVGSHAPNQEPQGIWRNLEVKKWSPLGVLKEAATIPRLEETLATRLGQERTPDWDESGGHHDKKRIAGWSFNARKSTTLQACWRWPIRDSSSCVYTNASVTNPPQRLSYQLCRLRESSSMHGMVGLVDGPSSLSRWREMPSLEKQSIDLSRLCWQTEEPGGPRVWKSSR